MAAKKKRQVRTYNEFVNESKEDKARILADKIQTSINSIDDSLGYPDLAMAVATVMNESYGSHNVKPFLDILVDRLDFDSMNEEEQKVVYPTNFAGMVQGAVSSIHSQVMAIAQELAGEKLARNPHRYKDAEKVGGIEEVDITRALNLIFHSDWKNMLKSHQIQQWAKSSLERAGKHDERAQKKNQRALRTQGGEQEDNYKVDLGTQGHSRDTRSSGSGSNQ